MRKRVWAIVALFGFLLPYAVGIAGSAMLGDNVRSFNFYRSGQLAASDDATTVATLTAYGLGLLAFVPWLGPCWIRLTLKRRAYLCGGLMLFAVLQFVAVFVVRFFYYIHSGGIFP